LEGKDAETEKKPKEMKEKRQKKLGAKILNKNRSNFAAAGLVGLGAMINYMGQTGEPTICGT